MKLYDRGPLWWVLLFTLCLILWVLIIELVRML